MFSLRRLAATALAVAASGLAVAETASAITIGDPIAPNLGNFPWTVQADTGRIETFTLDPEGGLPWALVSYRADFRFDDGAHACRTIGRFFAGKVGQIDDQGEFRPFLPGAGYLYCGGIQPGFEHDRASGASTGRLAAVVTDPPADTRRVHEGLVGRGVYAAWADVNGEWRPIPITPRGAYLVVRDLGWSGKVRLRATICGPFARTDLTTFPGAVVDGCTVTFVTPPAGPGVPGASAGA